MGRDRAVPIVVGECSDYQLRDGSEAGLPPASAAVWSGPSSRLPHSPVVFQYACANSSLHTVWQPSRSTRSTPPLAHVAHPTSPTTPAGPNTLLGLARGTFDRPALLARLVPAYVQLLRELVALGVPDVQVSG